ncbi:LysR family transcriptional regulator [Labrys okinawensis]|uniref:LysR family transcriptional regulator n=1 Tax=Labrys okinawensis TaxID=346911 RepID=A0A2S9QDI0_9HYPH|nr:LysR family transcriptional regulator [Labrys okinawensis]PRH87408.1 LysR family transcriptional regulator [Labrys okinawensis]
MRAGEIGELTAFVAIAEEGGFRRAAVRLNLTPSTLSHSLRSLEQRLGVRLINRTTRTVSLTAAGHALLRQVAPAFASIETAIETLNAFRDHPAGTVRISVPRAVAVRVLAPKFRAFSDLYPDVVLEIEAENGFVDIIRQGYDAGIRLGESLERDMIAVRVTSDLRTAVVASPDYFDRFPPPETPRDLHRHRCIGYRQTTQGGLYRWEFDQDGRAFNVAVDGPLILGDPDLMISAALDGVGVAYCIEQHIQEHLDSGRLLRVLEAWCLPYPGFFLYYPGRRQMPAALRVLVDFLRVSSG